ncbi:MAG: phosphoribosylanthranilate isomerase [Syntrophomonadaceae bacterium]|nr:phosphoribosylanthranilate isomerase [Syntrophomonadaceae bacterium]
MTRIMVCGSRQEADIELLAMAGVDAIGLITEVSQPLPCNLSREQARQLSALVPPLMSSVLILTEEEIEEVCRLVDYVRPSAVQLHGFNRPEEVAVLKQRLSVKIIKTLHLQGEQLLDVNRYNLRPNDPGPNDPGHSDLRHSDHKHNDSQHNDHKYKIRSSCPSNVGKQPDAGSFQLDNALKNLIAAYLEAGADAILLDSAQKNKVGSTGQVADFAIARQIRDVVWPRPFILAGGLQAKNVANALQKVEPYGVDVFSGVNREGYLDPQKVQEFVEAVRRVYTF